MDEPDGFGGRLRRYVAGPVLWGALEPLGSAAAPQGGRAGRYRVRLRYRPGVAPAMRLADGARRFSIRSADDPDGGLPPEKWSSLRYGFEPCGGCHHGTEEAYG